MVKFLDGRNVPWLYDALYVFFLFFLSEIQKLLKIVQINYTFFSTRHIYCIYTCITAGHFPQYFIYIVVVSFRYELVWSMVFNVTQHYFSYIVAASFIGGGKRSTRIKPQSTLRHERDSNSQLYW